MLRPPRTTEKRGDQPVCVAVQARASDVLALVVLGPGGRRGRGVRLFDLLQQRIVEALDEVGVLDVATQVLGLLVRELGRIAIRSGSRETDEEGGEETRSQGLGHRRVTSCTAYPSISCVRIWAVSSYSPSWPSRRSRARSRYLVAAASSSPSPVLGGGQKNAVARGKGSGVTRRAHAWNRFLALRFRGVRLAPRSSVRIPVPVLPPWRRATGPMWVPRIHPASF